MSENAGPDRGLTLPGSRGTYGLDAGERGWDRDAWNDERPGAVEAGQIYNLRDVDLLRWAGDDGHEREFPWVP